MSVHTEYTADQGVIETVGGIDASKSAQALRERGEVEDLAYLRRYFKIPGEMILLKLLMIGAVFYGAMKTASLAWGLGDIGVGLMAWLNIVAILILFFMGKPALKALADYERQRKEGVEKYTFDPEALGIKNADHWKK